MIYLALVVDYPVWEAPITNCLGDRDGDDVSNVY
jgi:hypothetical protein